MSAPILFIPHGGGPLPLLGDPGHAGLNSFLSDVAQSLTSPKAILVISAHWEETTATVSSATQPELIYDYYGFPDAAYNITYAAPGEPQLARRIIELLNNAGIEAKSDPDRGFDHGTFVPLKIMFPSASIPVVQLSLLDSLDPDRHIAIGNAIGCLAEEDVLILGSGMSFHNMQVFMQRNKTTSTESELFDQWLNDTLANPRPNKLEKRQALVAWATAPKARFSHPREEHLLPLHVCFGAAETAGYSASNVFNQPLLGARVSGILWEN